MRAWACLLLVLVLPVPAATADDTAPPVLEAWAFEQATYGPGDTVTITGRAGDETGLAAALGHLRGPGEWFDLWVHTEDCAVEHSGPFTCTFTLPDKAPSGTYRLQRWSMRDSIGHFGPTFHDELADRSGFVLSMEVEGPHDDAEPPVLEGLEVTAPTVQAGEPMRARVRAADATGVATVSLDAASADLDRYLGLQCEPDPEVPGTHVCSGPTYTSTPSGAYRIQQVTLRDENGVGRTYVADRHFTEDAQHAIGFTVEGGSDDHEPPVVDSIVATPVVPRGGLWSVSVTARDNVAVRGVQVDVQTLQGTAYLRPSQCPLEPGPAVEMTCSGIVPENYPLGTVRILFVAVHDDGGNSDSWSTWLTGGHYEVGPTMMDRFHIGPRAVSLRGNASVPVDAIDPYVLEAPPGSVLPFALRLAQNATDLSFHLVNEVDEVLGVQDCRSDFDPDHIGVRCRLIIPPEAGGVYELVAVGADNATAEVVGGPQRIVVTADAAAPEPLPDDWRVHVEAGVTLGTFNGGVREPVAPWTFQRSDETLDEADETGGTAGEATNRETRGTSGGTTGGATAEATGEATDGRTPGRVEPAPREDAPFPAALVLPLLALLAARAGRRR